MGGVEMGDGSDSSVDWGLYLSSRSVGFAWTTARVANLLTRFGGRLRSSRLSEKTRMKMQSHWSRRQG